MSAFDDSPNLDDSIIIDDDRINNRDNNIDLDNLPIKSAFDDPIEPKENTSAFTNDEDIREKEHEPSISKPSRKEPKLSLLNNKESRNSSFSENIIVSEHKDIKNRSVTTIDENYDNLNIPVRKEIISNLIIPSIIGNSQSRNSSFVGDIIVAEPQDLKHRKNSIDILPNLNTIDDNQNISSPHAELTREEDVNNYLILPKPSSLLLIPSPTMKSSGGGQRISDTPSVNVLKILNADDGIQSDELDESASLPFQVNNLGEKISPKDKKLKSKATSKKLNLFIGTWNLYAKPWPDNLDLFIPSPATSDEEFDIYVIGTEECLYNIESSLLSPSKAKWEVAVTIHLNKLKEFSADKTERFVMIDSISCGATHIMVFLKRELLLYTTQILSEYVITGLGNMIANKAGVACSFNLASTSFLFINAHFQSDQEKADSRNEDYHRINKSLTLRPGSKENVTDRFDMVFWSGDLNYRVNTTRKMADNLLKNEMLEVMLANDQLTIERNAGRIFQGFEEGEIKFPPTYKFDDDSDRYDSSAKLRIPSWTDRILYKPKDEIKLLKYSSIHNIRTSDHKPVIGKFQVTVDGLVEAEKELGEIPVIPEQTFINSYCNIM